MAKNAGLDIGTPGPPECGMLAVILGNETGNSNEDGGECND